MNNSLKPIRCLLDKNIARYAVGGLRYGHLRPLSSLERGALSFWRTAEEQNRTLFISRTSFHLLRRLAEYDEVRIFLNSVQVLSPTRYHARWRRRIREITRLTREDAAIIALTSFGSNQQDDILGTRLLITYDQAMINGYSNCLPELQRRLQAMVAQLPAPFHRVALPQIITPNELESG